MKLFKELKKLNISTAVVKRSGLGYIYAADPNEDEEESTTVIFSWEPGDVEKGKANFPISSCCIIQKPEYGIVALSHDGQYAVSTLHSEYAGNLFDDIQNDNTERKYTVLSTIAEIDGKAYAVGVDGAVHRMDVLNKWTCIDHGLPLDFRIQSIHGFTADDIYAVGLKGQAWHYNGKEWTKMEVPTNVHLGAVKCAADGNVYIAGNYGVLIKGKKNLWTIIEHDATEDNFYDVDWFIDRVYLSTIKSVYTFDGNAVKPVDFGKDTPKTCSQLSAAPGVMWSIGAKDVMSFDGKEWIRIV